MHRAFAPWQWINELVAFLTLDCVLFGRASWLHGHHVIHHAQPHSKEDEMYLRGDSLAEDMWNLLRMVLGYLAFAGFYGDNRTFSITFGIPTGDRELLTLRDEDAWEAAIRTLVPLEPWTEEGLADPISGVESMARLRNRIRRFVVDVDQLMRVDGGVDIPMPRTALDRMVRRTGAATNANFGSQTTIMMMPSMAA